MTFLQRMMANAWGLLPWPPDGEVVLRHEPSGRVLTDGSDPHDPVRFPSRAAAGAFRARYLDEAGAWEALPANRAPCRAPCRAA